MWSIPAARASGPVAHLSLPGGPEAESVPASAIEVGDLVLRGGMYWPVRTVRPIIDLNFPTLIEVEVETSPLLFELSVPKYAFYDERDSVIRRQRGNA